jgi:hypothetical protein
LTIHFTDPAAGSPVNCRNPCKRIGRCLIEWKYSACELLLEYRREAFPKSALSAALRENFDSVENLGHR